jgi:hypothetical protein
MARGGAEIEWGQIAFLPDKIYSSLSNCGADRILFYQICPLTAEEAIQFRDNAINGDIALQIAIYLFLCR